MYAIRVHILCFSLLASSSSEDQSMVADSVRNEKQELSENLLLALISQHLEIACKIFLRI
jgi:hypothetical protein